MFWRNFTILSQTRKQHEAGRKLYYLLHADSLLGLSSDPEDGGNMFVQNIS
jgi:hypothetical protein